MLGDFDYFCPKSLNEAVDLLQKPGAKVFAGGTDLIVSMRNGIMHPLLLVDIKKVEKLRITSAEQGELHIGAAVTVNELLESQEVREQFPILVEAAASLASYQVRNRATVIGNLCNASPAADMAPALLVLNAKLEIFSRTGTREIPLGQLFTGVKRTSLSEGEIVTQLKVPLEKGSGKYLKKSRLKGHDLSAVGVAGFFNGSEMRLAIGACAPTPVLCSFSPSNMSYDEILETAIQKVREITKPIADIRAGREYRIAIIEVYVERVLSSILRQEGEMLL